MARIGDYIDAGLNRYDPGDFMRGSALAAASVGQSLQQGVGAITDAMENRREKKEDIEAAGARLKAAMELFGDRNGYLGEIKSALDDKSLPLGSRAAIGKESAQLISTYIGLLEGEKDRSAENRRASIDERRLAEMVRQFDLGRTDEINAATATQRTTNERAKAEALAKFLTTEESAAPFGAKLPPMEATRGLVESLLQQGRGPEALSAIESYGAARAKQIEAAAKSPLLKPLKLGGTGPDGQPLEIDAFYSPDGRTFDINGNQIGGRQAWGDDSGGQSLPNDVSGDPIKSAIVTAANRYGVPAGHALSIVAQESGFNPNTSMESSSAKGLFQFLDEDRKQYGVSESSPLPEQIDAGMRKMRDNYAATKAALGREPTAGELYTTYYQGIGAGPAILANPNASFRDTLNQFGEGHANRVISANPWLKGISTNREFVDWSEKKMREKGFAQGAAPTPAQRTGDLIASAMPPEQRSAGPAPATSRRVPPMPIPQFGVRPLVSPKQTVQDVQSIRRAEMGDKRLETTLEQANTLAGSLDNLRQTSALLDQVRTGFGAESITAAKRVLGADVASAEQLQTLLGDQVMARVGQTKGAVSEKEMELFQQYSANFGKTTEGNKRIVDFATKAAERAKVIAATIQQGFASGKSPFEIEKAVTAIRDANPIANTLTPPPPAPGGIPVDEDAENAWLNSKPR